MSAFDDLVWEHKYRPKNVSEVILPKETTDMIVNFVKSGKVPNMLFSGTAGIGKTTLAYALANELDSDVLFINASLEGNIDNLRTNITQFVSSVSFSGNKKIVLCDEFDYTTVQSMPAWRGYLDTFSDNAVFIMTCNYKHRIIDPILSRLTEVNFGFTKEEKQDAQIAMMKRACYILDTEKIEYDKKSVAALVKRNFPDFRRTVCELQRYSSSGMIDSGILASFDEGGINALTEMMQNRDYGKLRMWVANNQMEPSQFYRLFYDKMTQKVSSGSVPQMIMHIGEYQFRSGFQVDQEINQMAFLVAIMESCQFQS